MKTTEYARQAMEKVEDKFKAGLAYETMYKVPTKRCNSKRTKTWFSNSADHLGKKKHSSQKLPVGPW